MKKERIRRSPKDNQDADTMRPEYDFSKAVRGETAKRYAEGTNVVVLDPDVANLFPDTASVNDALRALGKIAMRATPPRA